MIAIYTDNITPRLQYTLNLIFKTVLKVDYVLFHDKQSFTVSDLPKISYCQEKIKDEIHFFATNLLFENNIQQQTIEISEINGLSTFYHHNKNAILSFDAFAMIFYLVSRYEEYTETQRDKHGRFRAALSLAYKHGFLKIPLVNHLCLKIKSILNDKFPPLKFPKQQFQFLPTYDIDYAWSYLNKGFKRTFGGFARAILTRNFQEIIERVQVQFGQKIDPFYTFEILENFHQKHRLSPIYFFLIGDNSHFDKNISHKNLAFQRLIQQIATQYKIGLHPSYISNDFPEKVTIEQERLATISNQKIIRSRQHFLKLSIPKTYQNLIKNGIKEDYTMGYATQVGFRASIATPYFWYDLENETTTDLKIFPFQIMDVTLTDYLNLNMAASKVLIQEIIENTKAVNGLLSTLWHNNNINEPIGELYLNVLPNLTR
ncbi:MAG: polysaccharide deacetylase family protein [Saprospiraceae bacterium]